MTSAVVKTLKWLINSHFMNSLQKNAVIIEYILETNARSESFPFEAVFITGENLEECPYRHIIA